MLARLSLALVVSASLLASRDAKASPITYDFAGTLYEPVDGSSQFSGSFTIDTNPTVLSDGMLQENGNDVSLTVIFGSQTLSFGNSTQPQTTASFYGGHVPVEMNAGKSTGADPPVNQVGYSVTGRVNNGLTSLSINLIRSGTVPQVGDLENLASPSYTSSIRGNLPLGGNMETLVGNVTSIEQVSTPEPIALAVFGTIAFAAMAHRRFRRS